LTWLKAPRRPFGQDGFNLAGGADMTTSETIVTILIWLLAGCGGFFGLRARLRRRRGG
jgi:hypothetical protein